MTNNKPNTQVTIEFLTNLYENVDDQYYTINDPDKYYREEKAYDNFAELVDNLAQENYLHGKNIVNYIGNGCMMHNHHNHNTFDNCKLAMIDSSNILYLSVGIKYRDIVGTDATSARQDALKVAMSLPLKPTAIVDSGVSIQLYWKLDGYHHLSCSYEDLEEYGSRFFYFNREFCVQADAFWLMVNDYAYEAGLQLENTAVDIDWYGDVCTMDCYAMLPGFVHRFFNKENHKVEEFMVQIIEMNDRRYTDEELRDCIEDWIGAIRVKGKRNKKKHYRKLIQGFLTGKILYYTLVEKLPKTWGIPYRRRGNKVVIYDKEAREWLSQAEVDDLKGKEDFEFLYTEEEISQWRTKK